MAGLARFTDSIAGICSNHYPSPISVTGTIIEGSLDTNTDGFANARLFDMCVGTCGHVTYIVTGSVTVLCNARQVARVFDQVAGPIVGNITSGSSKSNAG